ncbi:exo-beta-N-acetylmuramidase NamZ family protein [Leeuwenhoekiella sp. W20_SRS_FM14]|uniref:exo-beta-N-acetylmuramidase NamZ family protein n=1 Tax=Leeuwenhoekiella sp. W20_SRS_FM14 TaxID=3240270 RepID=UPI003F9E75FE
MAFYSLKSTFFLVFVFAISCGNGQQSKTSTIPLELKNTSARALTTLTPTEPSKLIIGANRTEAYLPLLKNKRIAIVGNPSSLILKGEQQDGTQIYTHLVDSLLSLNQHIIKVFSPEHGFRGTADAGEVVKNGRDPKTGLEVTSLYGNHKKPKPEQLAGIDILVFDIQDVGVRFYTYIATLHYVLEAAADAGIEVLVLDRPNPNGSYVDGPVMEATHTSFLGMHAGVPLVHGMTIGEYATMMTQEGWLKTTKPVKLTVIPMQNYSHSLPYSLPVRPSPNLPNNQSVMLYPSLGLCEGTALNAGRGTEMQFQIIGSPYLPASKYKLSYKPVPNFGSKSPKFNGEVCNGLDLREISNLREVNLTYIIDAYANYSKKDAFFNTANFTAHAGTAKLQKQIESGVSFSEIKAGWSQDLERFKQIRSKYLLYKE